MDSFVLLIIQSLKIIHIFDGYIGGKPTVIGSVILSISDEKTSFELRVIYKKFVHKFLKKNLEMIATN